MGNFSLGYPMMVISLRYDGGLLSSVGWELGCNVGVGGMGAPPVGHYSTSLNGPPLPA